MTILTLSGWGQPHDALHEAAPEARHIEYAHLRSGDGVLRILQSHAGVRTLVGWSLGGQLAVQAVARGIVRPARLVLIATPYRFLQKSGRPPGMGRATFDLFRGNYARDAQRTLNKSYALIAHADTQAERVNAHLNASRARLPAHDWLPWLDLLAASDGDGLDFSGFPETLLVHGDRDAVVGIEHAHAFLARLPRAGLHVFEGCGHAPHWHDTQRLKEIIAS